MILMVRSFPPLAEQVTAALLIAACASGTRPKGCEEMIYSPQDGCCCQISGSPPAHRTVATPSCRPEHLLWGSLELT